VVSQVEQNVELANKMIFVRRYQEASEIIESLLEHEQLIDYALLHMRRIELAPKVGNAAKLKDDYHKMLSLESTIYFGELYSIMVDQHCYGQDASDALTRYQEHIKTYGPSAASYHGMGLALESMSNFDRAKYNYDEAIRLDAEWYPSYFGLSQVYYQQGDDKRGDHYFYLFEESAPFNVYGNFETHRTLYQELLQDEDFEGASSAIKTLGEWWLENRGSCPIEIQVYEAFALAKISGFADDPEEAAIRLEEARILTRASIVDLDKEGVLFFIARTAEEFGEHDLALDCYRAILKNTSANPQLVQKIGGQFLSLGDYDAAIDLFQDAYETSPNNAEIRFCLLVACLKKQEVNVEEYLMGKERLKQLVQAENDKVEILALLHNLYSKFSEDPEVLAHLGDIYVRLGNEAKAEQYYKKMYEFDSLSTASIIKYCTFMLKGAGDQSYIDILDNLQLNQNLAAENISEISWLKANYHYRQNRFDEADVLVNRALMNDPWNISYLVLKAASLTKDKVSQLGEECFDRGLAQLISESEQEIDWKRYDRMSAKIEKKHSYELAYVRRKLRFLYASGEEAILMPLIVTACRYDAARGVYDFLRLINTNFDSASIQWSIGMMQKELWQLETSCFWFEQVLLHPQADQSQRGRAFLELADAFIWRGVMLDKAVEYAKLALEFPDTNKNRAVTILIHGLIRSGQVQQAQLYADQLGRDGDPEIIYLKGLIAYRNGDQQGAKTTWKPLLTKHSESQRFHQIKQSLMKFYYDEEPYLKAN
jgi:tetratricopeptide (TPR) repeat protein